MKHLDARAIRERLNTVTLALTTLELCSEHPRHNEIALAAKNALREIAVLVTDDELEEHGGAPDQRLRRITRKIRAAEAAANAEGAGKTH